jgi:hypothetical protein
MNFDELPIDMNVPRHTPQLHDIILTCHAYPSILVIICIAHIVYMYSVVLYLELLPYRIEARINSRGHAYEEREKIEVKER